jgi:hypothetical protein
MSGLGTMISRAIVSPKSKTLLRYSRSWGSRTPEEVEEEIMMRSSSSEWASISSPRRMPQGLKTKLVEAFTSHTRGLNSNMTILSGRLIQSAVASARCMEKYLGACSPKTRCA